MPEKDRRISELRRELERKSREVEKLARWLEEMDAGISDVTNSRQWRLGRALGGVYRRLMRRPALPLEPEGLRSVRESYRAWARDEGVASESARSIPARRVASGSFGFCIKMNAPDWERAPSWGDLHFARAMERQLERRGHPCRVQTLREWDDPEGLDYEVAVHLKGLSPYNPKPDQLNVLWNISHPERLTARECERYDLVFVASERWANRLGSEADIPVIVLEQATDPEVFFPDYDPEHERDLVFVGNSRKVERRILRDLLPTDYNLAIWGADWEGLVDGRHVAGEHLPNDQVRKAYSSAAIVLNDHWDDMREHGFVSNRVYDALACGALVISDRLPEIREAFGDTVVTYDSPEELHRLVEHYLNSPEERAEKARRGREITLAHHTFEHRMDEMLEEVSRLARTNGP